VSASCLPSLTFPWQPIHSNNDARRFGTGNAQARLVALASFAPLSSR
jgi:hypothetical protein